MGAVSDIHHKNMLGLAFPDPFDAVVVSIYNDDERRDVTVDLKTFRAVVLGLYLPGMYLVPSETEIPETVGSVVQVESPYRPYLLTRIRHRLADDVPWVDEKGTRMSERQVQELFDEGKARVINTGVRLEG